MLPSLRAWAGESLAAVRRRRGLLAALVLLQVVAYGYLFTLPILTDHTFPNSWLYPYPSFKTEGEGRWLADLVILLQGGSGVPMVQMAGAALLQACNALLFSALLGIRGPLALFLAGGLLCLHPAFLDYYSFAADHLSFVLGDSFALLAAWVLLRGRGPGVRLGGAALLNMLALALYGPKISLVLLLALLVVLLRLCDGPPAAVSPPRPVGEIAVAGGGVLVGLLAFALSARLLIRHPILPGAHVNGLAEIAAALLDSPGRCLRYLTAMGGLPPGPLSLLPVLIVLLGLVALSRRLRHRSWGEKAWAGVVVLLLPVALNGAPIINSFTPGDRGRFVAAYAYGLVFFLAQALSMRGLRAAALALAGLLLWFFLSLGIQQASAAQFKTTYELSMLNRILTRLEPLLPSSAGRDPQPLLVVGRIPPLPLERYVRWPGRIDAPHLLVADSFAPYRQTEILNFLMGRELLRRPSAAQIDQALPRIRRTEPWPSPQSVFRDGDVLVVALEEWRPDGAMTWSQDR